MLLAHLELDIKRESTRLGLMHATRAGTAAATNLTLQLCNLPLSKSNTALRSSSGPSTTAWARMTVPGFDLTTVATSSTPATKTSWQSGCSTHSRNTQQENVNYSSPESVLKAAVYTSRCLLSKAGQCTCGEVSLEAALAEKSLDCA